MTPTQQAGQTALPGTVPACMASLGTRRPRLTGLLSDSASTRAIPQSYGHNEVGRVEQGVITPPQRHEGPGPAEYVSTCWTGLGLNSGLYPVQIVDGSSRRSRIHDGCADRSRGGESCILEMSCTRELRHVSRLAGRWRGEPNRLVDQVGSQAAPIRPDAPPGQPEGGDPWLSHRDCAGARSARIC